MLLILSTIVCLPVGAVLEMEEENKSYVFNADRHTEDAPKAYTISQILHAENFGVDALSSMDDICTDDQGNLYLADGDNHRVVRLSADGSEYKILEQFAAGQTTISLQRPTGLYIRDGRLYIADRGDGRIFVFNLELQYLWAVQPPVASELISENTYEPIKVCVDSGGRIYVISANQTQGIIQFSSEGEFIGFLGATRVEPTFSDLFWRAVASKEQKKSLLRLIPTEYNSMDIDEASFIYATVAALSESNLAEAISSRSSTSAVVRRLNPKGIDVLQRDGMFPPAGDINFVYTYQVGKIDDGSQRRGPSKMVDVACYENGIYTMLDSNHGRVFTYDKSGDLLFMFGGSGDSREEFSNPTAITYRGTDLIISDSGTKTVKVFTPTAYASKVLKAVYLHEEGQYEEETAYWEEIRREYIGSELAYLGLGRADMALKDYPSAMKNFQLADNKEYYSKAFTAFRRAWGYSHIVEVLLCIGGFLAIAIAGNILLNKRLATDVPKTLAQRVYYSKFVMFHPFKGFWSLKEEKIGTVASASTILAGVILLKLLQSVMSPYLFRSTEKNLLLQGFVGILMLTGLYILANWCLTSLMDGKGTMKDIYIYTCYSLTPYLILTPILILLSFVVGLEEMAIYQAIAQLATILMVFLNFCGTLVVHDYSFGKTIGTLFLIVIGMMILVFIGILSITLVEQILIYIQNVIMEIRLH